MISVAIIDDHEMIRRGVEFVLATHRDEFAFAGELAGGAGAGEFAARVKPDVILLDIRMPDLDGLSALGDIIAARPEQRVVMLTTSEADNDVYESVRLGAKGYLLKDRDSGDLLNAVREVANGGEFFPETIRRLYAEREATKSLSPRELETLELIAKGCKNDEISKILHAAPDTVKTYIKAIYLKLGVNDRVSATTEAFRRGFLRPEK